MDFNSYRPVALTSHLMKTTSPGMWVDHAVIRLLRLSLSHLKTTRSTLRNMFFDFPSAINTILPTIIRDKLEYEGVEHYLTTWILNYLTNRQQYVRTQGCVPDRVVCSTGAPQGTVLALFLFTIYIHCRLVLQPHHLLASLLMGATKSI